MTPPSPHHSITGSGEPSEKIDQGKAASTARDIEEAEANRKLSVFERAHRWDPNLDDDQLLEIDDAVHTRDPNAEGRIYDEVFEDSPYPEVRAAVRNYDEDLPVNTIRAWVIGMVLTSIASGLNALFVLRAPSLNISSIVVQLVAYPLGVGWAMIMPDRTFKTFGVKWNLSPGAFNFMEHGLIVIMANAASGNGAGYFTDILVAQRSFYGQNFGWGFNILLAFTTQCIGFSMAGLMRRYLVEPASMIVSNFVVHLVLSPCHFATSSPQFCCRMAQHHFTSSEISSRSSGFCSSLSTLLTLLMQWPRALVNTAFLYTLHDHSKTDPTKSNGWSISRYRYFLYVFIGSFVWYWFPGYSK